MLRKTPHERAYDLCNLVEAPGWGDDFTDALTQGIADAEKEAVAPFATALRDLVAVIQNVGNGTYARILRLKGHDKAILAYDAAVTVLAAHSARCPAEDASGAAANQPPALARES